MKFKVSQEPFLQGVSRVSGVIPTRTPLTFLYNIHATLSENSLTLTASDGDVFLITTVQVEGLEPGSILVPARPLLDLLREMPGVEIEFTTSPEQHLIVNTSKGKFTIPGEDPSRFPTAPKDWPPHKLAFSSQELKNILDQTTFAVSHDELRPALTGLLLQFMENEMRAVSTDGHRMVKLVRTSAEPVVAAEGEVEVIVPLRTLNLLQRNLDEVEKVDIYLANNRVVFDTGNLIITSKVVEGKFPAYDAVIPKDNPQHLQMDLEPFTAAVKRVSIFANPINRLVVLTLEQTSVKFFAEDPDSGRQGEEEVEALYTGQSFQIGYNANYLLEALRHMPGSAIDLYLGSPTSAGILKPRENATGQDLMMLLMPIRLQ
ncbi:MAG: DNA polymerase III subunit beta [bacterium]|nr:DNA polymerase III subunit beta [bacterium]